jgi:hypothetical protein
MFIRWQSRKLDRPQTWRGRSSATGRWEGERIDGRYIGGVVYKWKGEDGIEREDVRWSAILVESVRIGGKPRQRHIAYLLSFVESELPSVYRRVYLWDDFAERLDRLGNRVSVEDRKRIEAAIAAKIKRPNEAERAEVQARRLKAGEELSAIGAQLKKLTPKK